MAETDTNRMLRTVLVMQAEILGRLEALERSLGSGESASEAHMREKLGLDYGPTYDDPRLEALHQIREVIEAGENRDLATAIDDVVGLVNHKR